MPSTSSLTVSSSTCSESSYALTTQRQHPGQLAPTKDQSKISRWCYFPAPLLRCFRQRTGFTASAGEPGPMCTQHTAGCCLRRAKKDSRTPQQFREMNTLVPDIKVGFGVASDPPIHAFKPVSKARFMSGTPVILSSIHGHLYQAVQSLNLTRSEYRTKRALAGVSLYGGAGELLRFGIEARSLSR